MKGSPIRHEVRRRSGFTLLEVVASMSLCSLLLVALLSIAFGLGRTTLRVERQQRWDMCAEALLRAIHDELVTGWRPDTIDVGAPTRVRASEQGLSIIVRGAKQADDRRITYVFIPSSNGDGAGGIERCVWAGTECVGAAHVLGEVGSLGYTMTGGTLEVRIRSAGADERVRRFTIAQGGSY